MIENRRSPVEQALAAKLEDLVPGASVAGMARAHPVDVRPSSSTSPGMCLSWACHWPTAGRPGEPSIAVSS